MTHIEDFQEQEIGTRRETHFIQPGSGITHLLSHVSEVDIHSDASIRMTVYRGSVVLTQGYIVDGRAFRMLFNQGDTIKLENVDSKRAEAIINERFYVTKPRIKLSFTD